MINESKADADADANVKIETTETHSKMYAHISLLLDQWYSWIN